MGTYSSYYLYQKLQIIGNQDPVPVIPLTYSVSGDSLDPQPLVEKLENDPKCGYVPPVEYQYRDIESGYTCVDYDKYTKIVRQRSSDGIHWENVSYSAGTLIEHNSTDCGYVGELYRWVNSGTTCYEGDKYIRIIQQVSYDGINWTNTGQEARGTMIEADSPDCILYRWVDMDISTDWICDVCPDAEYRWIATTGYVCSGTNKMTKEIEQVSYDSGTTWQNVAPEVSRAALPVIEYDSEDCQHDYSKDYLTFVAKESGTFTFSGNSINYSLDSGSTWTTLASNTPTPSIAAGDKILWKATLTPLEYIGVGRFSSTGQFDAEGNAMSLLYGDNFIGEDDLTGKNYAFYYLFSGSTNMVSAENLSLPATTLANFCYGFMFDGCTSLTTAPVLPATTLASDCYSHMFALCTSLTTAPELPATTLANWCYSSMFYGCTGLTSAPELPATTLASNCYQGMFNRCSSLTTAPELPATTLVNWCYANMFYGCTKLKYIKCLATDISASSCTDGWVYNVALFGTFVKAASMTGWTRGYNGIPSNWTVQNY